MLQLVWKRLKTVSGDSSLSPFAVLDFCWVQQRWGSSDFPVPKCDYPTPKAGSANYHELRQSRSCVLANAAGPRGPQPGAGLWCRAGSSSKPRSTIEFVQPDCTDLRLPNSWPRLRICSYMVKDRSSYFHSPAGAPRLHSSAVPQKSSYCFYHFSGFVVKSTLEGGGKSRSS